MVPKDPPKTIEYENKKHVLTAEQWDTYKVTRGQTAYEMLTELINSEEYKNADDAAQVQMIDKVWQYADKVGKKAVLPEYLMDDTNVATITRDGKIANYNAEMLKALEAGDWEAYETMAEALRQEDVEESDIKAKIRDKYREEYKKAYRRGDTDRMSEIEEILDNTDYDFSDMIADWEEQVEEKYGI